MYRLRTALLLCLVLNLALFSWVAITNVRFLYGINYGEASLIDLVERIIAPPGSVQDKADLSNPPYVITNYPPIYPFLIAGVGSITGLSFLQVGRTISLLAAILFLGHPFVMRWAALARLDMVALSLSLFALWFVYRYWHSWPWLIAALICLVAAIYTKQTFVLAVPMAAVVWLLYTDRRRGLAFITILALTCLTLFGLLNLITQGGFYLNTVVANVKSYKVAQLLVMMAEFLRSWSFALIDKMANHEFPLILIDAPGSAPNRGRPALSIRGANREKLQSCGLRGQNRNLQTGRALLEQWILRSSSIHHGSKIKYGLQYQPSWPRPTSKERLGFLRIERFVESNARKVRCRIQPHIQSYSVVYWSGSGWQSVW